MSEPSPTWTNARVLPAKERATSSFTPSHSQWAAVGELLEALLQPLQPERLDRGVLLHSLYLERLALRHLVLLHRPELAHLLRLHEVQRRPRIRYVYLVNHHTVLQDVPLDRRLQARRALVRQVGHLLPRHRSHELAQRILACGQEDMVEIIGRNPVNELVRVGDTDHDEQVDRRGHVVRSRADVLRHVERDIRYVVRLLVRFGILWALDAVSIVFTAWLLPGINLVPTDGSVWITAAAAAFMLGIVNLLIRPLILLLVLPLGFFVIFGIGFIANALAILITSALLPAFQVEGFVAAFLGGLVMAAINTVAISVISVDDDDSFFQGLVERLAGRNKNQPAPDEGHGLVMLEIDGCSYYHMQDAIKNGQMPHMKRLMEEQGYELSRVDCGIPSQTSACQAGILFGDSYDIPAFRWYDKEQGRTYVSGKDAPEINARYAKGSGLLRGGSSINNMMNGDAAKSLLTLADLKTGTPEEKKSRAHDIYLLMINPYFVMRTIVLVITDALREVWQYQQDKRKDVQPRPEPPSQGLSPR